MRKIRLLLLAVFAVLAVGAVASAAASAAACVPAAGTLFALCISLAGVLELQTANAEFTGEMEGNQTHKFNILTSTNITLECSQASVSAIGEPILAGTGNETLLLMKKKIIFKNCTTNTAACVVDSTIITESSDATISLAEELEGGVAVTRLDVLIEPEPPATVFATFSIKSKEGETCLGAVANGKVKGKILCYFLEPIEEDELEHLVQCDEFGSSELTYAGNAVDGEAEFSLKLTGSNAGDMWSIVEGT